MTGAQREPDARLPGNGALWLCLLLAAMLLWPNAGVPPFTIFLAGALQCVSFERAAAVAPALKNREADGGQSGSSLENGNGDSFYYYANGSLGVTYRNYADPAGWPNKFKATGDARVDPSTLTAAGATADTYPDSYNYDAAGNRSGQVLQLNPEQNLSYAANDDNFYTSPYQIPDASEDNANAGTGWQYFYDAEGKMTSANNGGSGELICQYDGLGRLVVQDNEAVGTIFYYSGNQRIEERNYNNAVNYLYFYAAPGSDQILFRQDSVNGRLWYLSDLMGNTTHLLNDAGQTVEQYAYDPYGTPSFYDGSGNARSASLYDNRYLFQGASAYEWLSAEAMYYCRARFYLPEHGRFLSPDPIGQAGGLNLYAYCGNDPVNGSDPIGLDDDDNDSGDRVIVSAPGGPPAGLIPGFIFLGLGPGVKGGNLVWVKDPRSGIVGFAPDPSAPEGVVQPLIYTPPSVTRGVATAAASFVMSLSPISGGLMLGAVAQGNVPLTDGGFNREAIAGVVTGAALTVASGGAESAESELGAADSLSDQVLQGDGATEEGAVSGGGQCFPKGTLVATPTGERPIEDLEVGNLVYSYDFDKNQVVEAKIEKLSRNFTYHWAAIAVDGDAIRSTRSHPFWVENENRWYKAADLKPGMKLRRQNGSLEAIRTVVVDDLKQPQDTYNFSVAQQHNYFVGNNRVLVHNGPDFIVTPTGKTFIVPKGAVGPLPTRASGFQFVGGAGGNGLNSRVTGLRFMDPNSNQGFRASYMNNLGQTVDPNTGRTILRSDPLAHIPCP
jgi:RHS repeat-associated protein